MHAYRKLFPWVFKGDIFAERTMISLRGRCFGMRIGKELNYVRPKGKQKSSYQVIKCLICSKNTELTQQVSSVLAMG